MNAIGDGRAQILTESRRESQPLQRRKSARWSGCGLGHRRAKHLHDAGGGRELLLRWRFRRGRRLEILNIPPPVAFRPPAAAPARALRVADRPPHLERETSAQEGGEG